MASESVEWITLHAEEGDHLAVEGDELRTPEAAAAWEPRAERWTEGAIHGVEVRRREDVGRIRTLGRRPLVPAPVGNPYWTPPRAGITHGTTSVECAESTPLSRLHDRIESLKEIARDWRMDPPEPLIKQFPIWSNEADEAYAERVASVRKDTGKRPTKDADFAWGKEHGLRRDRVRELRQKFS